MQTATGCQFVCHPAIPTATAVSATQRYFQLIKNLKKTWPESNQMAKGKRSQDTKYDFKLILSEVLDGNAFRLFAQQMKLKMTPSNPMKGGHPPTLNGNVNI